MRELFADIFVDQPIDPIGAARRAMRPPLRRRFYSAARVVAHDGAFPVLLDGRMVRTPARHCLSAPTRALAEAIAAEWNGQTEFVDPANMPLTRLVNTILDGVVSRPEPVATEVSQYLGLDLLFYRADRPDELVKRQAQHWDPLIDWAREALAARFVLAQGVVHVTQPDHALAAAAGAIPRHPWRLGAVHSITTLTGSALIALALAGGRISADQAWAAAHVDEDWNMEQWGRDALALQRRRFREAELHAAVTVLRTVPDGS